ncbi:MAG: tRNA uracil 4-sulfurtransferase ThiI [Patescibacteria group bacterium]
MRRIVLIHYNEIALKGRNRPFFERALLGNIKRALAGNPRTQRAEQSSYDGNPRVQRAEQSPHDGCAFKEARIIFGRIVVWLEADADEKAIAEKLNKVFGIANFSFSWEMPSEFSKISDEVLKILKEQEFKTFRVTARRAGAEFPMSAQEINEKLGALIVEKLEKKVDLKNYDLNCYLEIVGNLVFFYLEKEKGLGGLPVGVSGKVLSLLSSGFDSPIASWQLMRRGCRVDFVHFHSYPQTSKESQENVKELTKILNQYQASSKLFLIPFLDIQKEISAKSEDASQRVVLYRRFMMRIAEKIAERERCGALVTGDSLGQVASQTLENIGVISQATNMPIFRPLIGTNKDDIIDTTKKIGTYEISSHPYDDCCSLFLPEHPETRAKLEVILEIEKNLDVEKLISEAIGRMEILEL